MIQKGCDAYLTYILDFRLSELKVDQVLSIYEFTDVFLEEFSSLQLELEIKLVIKLMLGIALILIANPTKLKELKA